MFLTGKHQQSWKKYMNNTHNVLSYFRVCWTLKRLLSFRTPGVLIKNIWPAGETRCGFVWLKSLDVRDGDECADAPTAFHLSFYLFHSTCLYVVQVERKPLSHSATFSTTPRVNPSDGHYLSLHCPLSQTVTSSSQQQQLCVVWPLQRTTTVTERL